jgi:hypothetical protein
MPGFTVQNIGGHQVGTSSATPSNADYFYNYSWYIESLFVGFRGNNVIAEQVNERGDALLHVRDVTLPTFTANKDTIKGTALDYKFANGIAFDDVKVTWYDTNGLINIIRSWRESVWTPERGISTPGEYKKDSYINQYILSEYNNNNVPKIRHKLHGSWPSIIRHGDLTYTSSDIKVVEVTITYDWAVEEFF